MSGIDLEQMRNGIRSIGGIDEDDEWGDNDSIDLFANRSLWEVMNKFHFRENERTSTFTINAPEVRYQLPVTFEAVRNIGVINPDTSQPVYLERMDSFEYQYLVKDPEVLETMPTRYLRENNVVIFWPTPDQDYEAVIRQLITIEDLSESNNELVIPREWHEIVMYGGGWRLLSQLGDTNRMKEFKGLTDGMMLGTVPVQSKEETDSKLAGANYGYPRSAGYGSRYTGRLRYR